MTLAFTMLALALAAAAPRDVVVPSLPEGDLRLVATPDGGAWLLGAEERSYSPFGLWRFDAGGGAPKRIALPAGRAPVAAVWSPWDGALWLAGYDWVGVLGGDGSLRARAIESRDLRGLAAIGPGRAVLARHLPNRSDGGGYWSAELLFVGAGEGLPVASESFTGGLVSIGNLVADGRGGFWAVMISQSGEAAPRQATGYLHRAGGSGSGVWRAWMPGGRWPDFVEAPPGVTVAGASPPELGPRWGAKFAIADGAGGFYFHTGAPDGFYRVPADGGARAIERARLPNGGDDLFWNDVVFDDTRRAALFLVGGARRRDLDGPERSEPLHLSLFDGERVTGEERLPSLPSWGREEWVRGTVSNAGGATWIAYPGLVMRQASGGVGWTRFMSQKMKDRLGTDRRERAGEIALQVIAGLLGAAAALLAGARLASRAGRVPPLPAALQIGAASLCAAPAGLLALTMNPLVRGVDELGMSLVLCLIGLGLEIPLAAVAAGAMGSRLAPNRRPSGAGWLGAAAGATLGAAVAAIAGLFVDSGIHHLLDSVHRDVEALRWSIAIVLGGLGATLGYLLSRRTPNGFR